MSKLGIIFAFLLSVVAASGSYYLYHGWVEERTVRNSVEAKYDQVKEKIIMVQSEKEQIAAKSEEYRTKAEAMQGQLETLQTAQQRIDSEKAALEEQLKTHQTMVADLQQKMVELEKKAREAQAACGVTPADLRTGAVPAAVPVSGTSASEAETSQLVFKPVTSGGDSVAVPMPPVVPAEPVAIEPAPAAVPAAQEDSAVVATPAPEVPAVTAVEPAPVEAAAPSAAPAAATTGAKVLTVNRKFNFVVINQGLQEGLKMGDKLKVFKNGKENATVQIEKLYDRFSAATLLEEDPKLQVVEGDEIRKA